MTGLQADTLVITGCTTSGHVLGTVADAFSYNFRVVVPEECVYDPSLVSHPVNLFDRREKYADGAPLESVIQHLSLLEA